MFVNQINSKDLFTTNPMKVYGNKEYPDSQNNSQMCSQLEFSNSSHSQDCFSQQMNVGFSQNESPQKKSYYQKFVSRGPLFSHGSKQQSSTSRSTHKQDLEENKVRAKERDERDLLYRIVNTVSQSADEVKSAVELVKENSQNASASSNKKVADFLHDLQTELDKRYEDIVTAVGRRDESKQEIQSLREEVAAKNATIDELREKVEKLQEDQDEKMVDALRGVYKEQQELNREQIHKYHEKQLEELSKQANLHKGYQASLESHTVQLKHHREKTQQQLCQLEARVSKELDMYQKEQEKIYSQMTSDCREQLKDLHQDQRNELVDYFHKQMSKMNNVNNERQQELEKLFREEIESLGKQQMQELEAMIHKEVKLEAKSQQVKSDKVLQQSLDNHREEQEKVMMEVQHHKTRQQRCVKEMEKQTQAYENEIHQLQKDNLTKKEEAEQEERKAKEMQHTELNNLRRKHDQEFEALKQKYQTNSAERQRSQLDLVPFQGYNKSVVKEDFACPPRIDSMDRTRSEPSDSKGKHDIPFVSPSFRKNGWSSEELFRKGGPSPLATMYPIKKNSSCDLNKLKEPVYSDVEEDPAPAKGKKKGVKPRQGKAKKKLVKAPSRRQPKRTASTPGLDERKQDSTPAWEPPRTRRRNASAPTSENVLSRTRCSSPDWIPKRRRTFTPSAEQSLKPIKPTTPSWLQAHREALRQESRVLQGKNRGKVEQTPPVWKKQLCNGSLATPNSGSQARMLSPYSLRSYSDTPKLTSGHIECSRGGLQKFQSPYHLRTYGGPNKLINTQTKMQVFDFVDDGISVSGNVSYRKMTFEHQRHPSLSPADARPSHAQGFGDNADYNIITNQDVSDSSQGSSPSLSVTEFILKRKTKKERSPPGTGSGDWQYMASYGDHNSLMSPSGSDMFGSPDAYKSHMQSSDMPVRRTMKRRLCEDEIINTQVLEITRCIKQQQRVTPNFNKK